VTDVKPLSSERVLDVALAIIGRKGVAGLSMRDLANELGAGQSGTYGRIGGKAELLRLATDRVVSTIPYPDPSMGPWFERLRTLATGMRTALTEYPGIAPYVSLHLGEVPAASNTMRLAADIIVEAGLDRRTARQAVAAVGTFVVGSLIGDDGAPPRPVRAGRPPAGRTSSRRLSDADFRFGLDLIIDGLVARSLAEGRTSDGPSPNGRPAARGRRRAP
jgi:AcrR family transcriptional regulator